MATRSLQENPGSNQLLMPPTRMHALGLKYIETVIYVTVSKVSKQGILKA
jgi:hypothetical protein